MENKIKVLYISYDGMTDPLGQSQVIPYLAELVKRGVVVHILSAEKQVTYFQRKDFISELLKESRISWHPVFYTKKPPIISTIKDILTLKRQARKLHSQFKFDIVHCRSYISAFVGMYLKKKLGVKFIFDMRGFYADERVDGMLWPQKNPVYKMVYRYFKKKEKQFLSMADYTVSLTYAGKEIIQKQFGFTKTPIEVIPCCADLEHFNFNKTELKKTTKFSDEVGIMNSDFILSYLGSIGTWYMLKEMLLFFKVLKRHKPEAKFLFITRDNPEEIFSEAKNCGVNIDDIIIKAANREEVPEIISISDASVFFIKPVFSKKASSPTKLAELLGMGIPVICNSNVGDIDKFVPENNLGIMIDNLDDKGFEIAAQKIDTLREIDSARLRKVAQDLFSLEIGSDRYFKIYNELCKR